MTTPIRSLSPFRARLFYGQDAQYLGNLPSFTVSGDTLTVYDNNTGLTWVRTPDTNGDGTLDAQGQASAQVNTSGALPSSLEGTTLYFAYLVHSPIDFASNAIALDIEP